MFVPNGDIAPDLQTQEGIEQPTQSADVLLPEAKEMTAVLNILLCQRTWVNQPGNWILFQHRWWDSTPNFICGEKATFVGSGLDHTGHHFVLWQRRMVRMEVLPFHIIYCLPSEATASLCLMAVPGLSARSACELISDAPSLLWLSDSRRQFSLLSFILTYIPAMHWRVISNRFFFPTERCICIYLYLSASICVYIWPYCVTDGSKWQWNGKSSPLEKHIAVSILLSADPITAWLSSYQTFQ